LQFLAGLPNLAKPILRPFVTEGLPESVMCPVSVNRQWPGFHRRNDIVASRFSDTVASLYPCPLRGVTLFSWSSEKPDPRSRKMTLHTEQQSKEMQVELDNLMAARPALRRLSDRKMNTLVRELAVAFDAGHRGSDLIATLVC
jgi:hypothetical protein